jgi:hypothetical protein
MEIQIMKPEERNYTYSQSQQISMQTGCIGHLRADMDSSGEGFFSSWDDFRKDLKTQEFKDELDTVINELRKDGNFLCNRKALSEYCHSHPEASFGKDSLGNEREFGVRVNTDSYAYMMRINPHKGEYNLYCYCYRKEWLDNHLEKASKGIRFIDSSYNELFKIKDGEQIVVTTSWGEKSEYTCRYIDDYHTEVGNNLYHICEFAERMEQNKATYEPKESALPDMCYSVLPSSGELIVINKDEKGYRPYTHQFADSATNREMCDQMNKNLGVTKRQEAAMLAGSMFGWKVPAANPKNYDGDGNPIKPPHKHKDKER